MGNRFKRKVANQKKKQSEAKRALELVANACQWLEGFGQEVNDRTTATALCVELVFDHLGWDGEQVAEKLKAKKAVYQARREAAEAEEKAKQDEIKAKLEADKTDLDREVEANNAKVDEEYRLELAGRAWPDDVDPKQDIENAKNEQTTETGSA
jgi:hypothetical protein